MNDPARGGPASMAAVSSLGVDLSTWAMVHCRGPVKGCRPFRDGLLWRRRRLPDGAGDHLLYPPAVTGRVRIKGSARGVHPHGLRHTFANELRAAGVDVVVSKLLGHSSIAVTSRYLDHLTLAEAFPAS
jgi:integrase